MAVFKGNIMCYVRARMRTNANIARSILAAALMCAAVTVGGCRKAPELRPSLGDAKPVAEARQSIKSPTLSIKAPESQEEQAPPTETEQEEPRGPITLPPAPPLEETPEPPEAPAAPTTTAAEGASLATLPGTQQPVSEPSASGVAALPAPDMVMETEPQPSQAEPVLYEPRLVTAKTNIDIILDASGSMSAPLGAGTQSKFDALRQALYEVIYEMNQQQADFPRNIAVRLMGSQDEASANNCQDTELAVAMGEPNLNAIRLILDKVVPQGQSPVASTLEQSVDDFPTIGGADRVIVLVADGGDSCDGSPCEIAAGLAEGIVVHVIAFDVAPEDQEQLSCIPKNTDGQLFLARNDGELKNSLDQALNSTIPYNLKLSATAGGAPLPVNVIVFRAGTEDVVRKSESLGTKLLSLPPDSYDILIEYAGSPETKKPSKILKGVEVLKSMKVEQTVNFDLGRVTVTALDNEGKPVRARFSITKDKGAQVVAAISSGEGSESFYLPPGTYDILAELAESQPDSFTVQKDGIVIKNEADNDIVFKFQKGTLSLRGVTTQGQEIPFLFHISKAGTKQLIASGALPREGGSVLLAPGDYDMIASGEDPAMTASPRTKVSNISIKAAEPTDLTVMFEMGSATLSATDGKGNKLPAEFVVKDQGTGIEMARAQSPTGEPVKVDLPPGTYDIVTSSLKSELEPKPSVPTNGVVISADKTSEVAVTFVLGTLRLRGRNAKEQPMRTQFTIYKVASDEVAAKAPPSADWMVFDLAPGLYDALAVDMQAGKDVNPMIWIRDIKIEDGKTVSHEAIFTAGKLKVIGRGPNNKIIKTDFKVYQYGSDRELITGETGNDWEIFEIEPGQYYIEASYHDEQAHVLLKKWINVTVGENEVVELVIRF
jgi:hypothetical protein